MALQLPRGLDTQVKNAVRHFWDTRSTQAGKQQKGGRADQGARSAVDLWTAYRDKAFNSDIKPWLGYLFLLEDCPRSQRAQLNRRGHRP